MELENEKTESNVNEHKNKVNENIDEFPELILQKTKTKKKHTGKHKSNKTLT